MALISTSVSAARRGLISPSPSSICAYLATTSVASTHGTKIGNLLSHYLALPPFLPKRGVPFGLLITALPLRLPRGPINYACDEAGWDGH